MRWRFSLFWHRGIRAILLAAFVSGCAGPLTAVPDDEFLPAEVPIKGFESECPPGVVRTRADGVCIGTIRASSEAYSEPVLAVHPDDPRTLAVGAHSIGATATRAIDSVILVSRDGGATFSRRLIPTPPSPGGAPRITVWDPALLFDAQGVLHFTGIVQNAESVLRVFYTSSGDLAGTWTQPVELSSDRSDRNWMALSPAGRIWVSWWSTAGANRAWSDDGGNTWHPSGQRAFSPDCRTVSPPLPVQEAVLVACVDPCWCDKIQVWHLEPPLPPTRLPDAALPGSWPYLTLLPNGTVAMLAESAGSFVSTSADRGANWTPPEDLLRKIPQTQGWAAATTLSWRTDPWGLVHLTLKDVCSSEDLGCGRGIVHAVFDPAGWRLVHSLTLASRTASDTPLPPPAGVGFGDDTAGLAFMQGQAMLIWPRGGELDYTMLRPQRPD